MYSSVTWESESDTRFWIQSLLPSCREAEHWIPGLKVSFRVLDQHFREKHNFCGWGYSSSNHSFHEGVDSCLLRGLLCCACPILFLPFVMLLTYCLSLSLSLPLPLSLLFILIVGINPRPCVCQNTWPAQPWIFLLRVCHTHPPHSL